MRKITLIILLAITFSAIAQNPPSKKLALIVAVGNYPQGSACPPIASIYDIQYVKAALKFKGFNEKDIDTLKDAKATKAGILKSLNALAKKATPNSFVVIHFSCHGQQIQDQATDAEGKDEQDGYDEALLPYDAKGLYNPTGYNGENHLRDDTLEKIFLTIRNNIKPNGTLLVLADACHSGTISRAAELSVSRGIPLQFQEPGYKPDSVLRFSGSRTNENSFFGDGNDALANMVTISASAAHQQNYQMTDEKGKGVGSLTYAFYKALNDMQPGDDYQLLFDKIKARIQSIIPTQIPIVEGNTAQQVFGAQFNKVPDEIKCTISTADKKVKEDSVFVINRGALHNITKGSVCKIFIAGKQEPVAEGVIVNVGPLQSSGIAKKLLKKEESYRAEISAVSYGDFSTALFINDSAKKNALLEKQLTSFVKPYQFINISKNADLILDIHNKDNKVYLNLIDRGDSTRWQKELAAGDSLSTDDAKDFISSIKNSVQIKYLRSLTDGGDLSKNFSVKLYTPNYDSTKELILKPGDKYTLSLKNNSTTDELFYSIVDIMPDNSMKVLIPTPSTEAPAFSLGPKLSKSFSVTVDTNTPAGKEIFKVFVTKEPLDLKNIFGRKKTRSEMKSLEDMVNETFKDSNAASPTRSDISSVKVNETGILTVGFTVQKK